MANTITLRAYLDELEHLLDARSPTEVISHCRYILQHYPRNVDAYRLLGRALLERGERDGVAEHYDEALEMFQRVLSVLPNDYMAHLGVSQIFQEKGELERAIWHLERAYEQMPGNQALQEALRGLYAQRSGTEEAPARLQLTRGALAHQYIRAQQFEQALVELRAALAEEKDDRLDLQVLLAEVLWDAGHVEEAAEQAARILEALPDCLAANRILARYWLEHERPSDAQVFLERIEAVDPYEARRTLQPETDAPDPNLLERLDYGTQAQAATSSETPDWVEELGDLGDFAMEQGSPFAAEPEAPAAPLDAEALFGAPPVEPSADWVADVGASASSPFGEMAWPEPETPPMPTAPEAEADAPLDLGADWLAEADLGAPEPEAPAPDDAPLAPDWLDDVPSEGDAPLPPDWLDEVAEADAGTAAETAPESDWMAEVGEAPHAATSELASPADVPDEPAAPASADDEAAWLFSLGEAEAAAAEETVDDQETPSTGFTDLLAGIQSQRAVQESLWEEEQETAPEPEPEPPDWLSDFVETDAAVDEDGQAAEPQAESEAPPTVEDAGSVAADLFDLFEEEDAQAAPEAEAPSAPEAEAAEQPAPLDAPEWLVEPEYDFFAPEETPTADAAPTAEAPEGAPAPQDTADDWLDTLEEADESDLSDVLLSAADEWQSAEAQAATLDWLSEDAETSTDEDVVEALFAAAEEAPSLMPSAEEFPAEEQGSPQSEDAETAPAAEPQDADWLATLPVDEDAVLTTVDAADEDTAPPSDEAEVTLTEGEAAVESVLDTLEAEVPELEENVDQPLAFEAVEETLFGDEEEPAAPRTSSLEERVAQIAQSEDSPAWLAGMEAETSADAEFAPSDEEQAVEYRAAGQTGILQPDEAPAWMAAFTGEDVPEEPEAEPTEEPFGAPEAEITPPQDVAEAAEEDFSTRILQPEAPATATGEHDLFGDVAAGAAEVEAALDTDELFADVLDEMTETAAEAEEPEDGELPAWLQAITQSEADKLDESLFAEVEPYSSSAEDSGILQPGQEDEWLQVLEGEPSEQEAEESPPIFAETAAPEADDELLHFLADEAPDGEPVAVDVSDAEEAAAPEADEALLDFLDVDAAAIAEMDFEDIAVELEEAAQMETSEDAEQPAEWEAPRAAAEEMPVSGAVAEAPDLSHTMAEDAHARVTYEDEASEAPAAPEDEFSFDGVVPRWLRRPRERIADEATEDAPTDDDAPSGLPEWLRDVSEDLDRQDRDDLQ